MLTVMIGRCELMKSKLGHEHPLCSDLDTVITTGERASMVSRNLQAFSRQQHMRPKLFNLNESIAALQDTLTRMSGEIIVLEFRLAPDLALINADSVKIDEVIINLVKNAIDAMPTGGNLVIETSNVFRDHEFARTHEAFKAGNYVLLSVSDSGCGMDEATRARIFQPFFTTKGRARRTGLGLAMVYGTVKQSDGFIYGFGEPKKGSRFDLYFPRIEKPLVAASAPVPAAPPPDKTILVVDDEPSVLQLVTDILAGCGYAILSADSPKKALKIAETHSAPIDLLLTDVLMPEMSGSELSLRISAVRPAMKVLFMSGFADKQLETIGIHDAHFVSKPFTMKGLRSKVQEILEKP